MPGSEIEQYLESLRGSEPVSFAPNPGNAGDSLIAHATFQLFRKLGIEYRLFDPETSDPAGKVVVYGGGGNLVRYYDTARRVIQASHRAAKRLVLLPQTIEGNEDLLDELGRNVDIICREEVSYRHVRANAPRANVLLMHDMAFSLSVDRTLSEKPISLHHAIARKAMCKLGGDESWQPQLSPRTVLQSYRFGIMQSLERLRDPDRTLECFRTDVEKTGPAPRKNLDLSRIFAHGTSVEALAAYSSYRLLKFMRHYREVRTNRLHLCIAGALLGAKVKLFPNALYKCEAVYHFSMKDRFQNVEWMGG